MEDKKSNLKRAILNDLSSNLDELIASYEIEIEQLTAQVREYKTAQAKVPNETVNITNLKRVNEELILENNFLYDLLLFNTNENQLEVYFERLKQSYPDNTVKKALKFLNKLLDLDQFKFLPYCLRKIKSLLRNQDQLEDEWLDLFIDFLGKLFESNPLYEEQGDDLVECYLPSMKLCIDFVDTPYDTNIKIFLIDYAEIVNSRILELNDTEVIAQLAQCYFTFELKDNLKMFVEQVINEWDFIDANISEEEFIKLLWYMFLVEKDQELIDRSAESIKYMRTKKPEMELYILLNDVLNGENDIKESKVQIDALLNYCTLFSDYEKVFIREFLDEKLKEYERVSTSIEKESISTKMLTDKKEKTQQQEVKELRINEISKLPNKVQIHNNLQFKEREAILAVYDSESTPFIHHHTKITVRYLDSSKEYFISKNQLRFLKRKEKGYWINIVYKTETNAFLKRERIELKGEPQPQQVIKPVTIVPNISNVISHQEEIDLNSKSALRNLGYQITGLTRAKRWEILSEKAVPKLGLKRVVDTIAFLVRGRKAMKNGMIRNSYSISEWEYDLEKLKKHFYKHDFRWPKTTI